MADKIFDSNNEKLELKVVISVYQNCAQTEIFDYSGKPKKITYHELIGILEAQKQHIIWTQREANMKISKSKKKSTKTDH